MSCIRFVRERGNFEEGITRIEDAWGKSLALQVALWTYPVFIDPLAQDLPRHFVFQIQHLLAAEDRWPVCATQHPARNATVTTLAFRQDPD